jgi:hypothetical protein
MSRRILITARVAISLVGIVYFFSIWRQLDFVWHGHSQTHGAILCAALSLILVLRAIGLGGWWTDRTLSVLHLIGANQLFTPLFPYGNINEGLYMMLAFWSCFIQWNPAREAQIAGWPSILLGINLGVLLCASGIDKCGDYLWQQGYGFYHFLRLNWIRSPSADWMLAHTSTLWLVNYVALIFECGTVLLMFFRRTRLIGTALLAGFFASLIWPFRMDMIGPVGLCICLTIAAGAVSPARPWPPLAGALAAYIAVVGGELISGVIATTFSGHIHKPAAYVNAFFKSWLPPAAERLNGKTTAMCHTQLFTSIHTMNIYAWRILVEMPDGSRAEPIRVFNADRSGGTATQAIGSTRHIQAVTYQISDFALFNGKWPHDQIDVLMECAIARAGGKSATLVVSSLDHVFDGKWKPIRTVPEPPKDQLQVAEKSHD